jgi:hypothetical protein
MAKYTPAQTICMNKKRLDDVEFILNNMALVNKKRLDAMDIILNNMALVNKRQSCSLIGLYLWGRVNLRDDKTIGGKEFRNTLLSLFVFKNIDNVDYEIRLPEELLNLAKILFNGADKNNDGKTSEPELVRYVLSLFDIYKNEDGRMTYAEFLLFVYGLCIS